MTELINLNHVTKEYKENNADRIVALNDVSISVKTGELVAIIGPSGSGKSTFLTVSGALLKPTSGTITIGGVDISEARDKELSNLRLNKIGFILQSSNLVPYLSVIDQLLIVKRMKGKVTKADKRFAIDILSDLGLEKLQYKYPQELSGGQKQRVAIGRSLMNDPDILLADEPTASLDSKKAHEVVQLLKEVTVSRKKATVMVTHDERLLSYCDKIFSMNDGILREQ